MQRFLLCYRWFFVKGNVFIGEWGIFGAEVIPCYSRFFIKGNFVIGGVECTFLQQRVMPSVVNPAYTVLSPTVDHLHKVLREKDGESFFLLRERKKKINKTISYKWLLNIPLSYHRKNPYVKTSD